METRETVANYRLTKWAKIIQECRESGLSVKDYCKTAEFHENTYFYWQKKIREAISTGTFPLIEKETKITKAIVPQGWALCETNTKKEAEKEALQIEIGKSRVIVTADVDQSLLTKVCRVLVEIC